MPINRWAHKENVIHTPAGSGHGRGTGGGSRAVGGNRKENSIARSLTCRTQSYSAYMHMCTSTRVWHKKRPGTLREGEALGRREAQKTVVDTSKRKVHWYTHKEMPSGNPLCHALTKNNSKNLKEHIERVPKLLKHTEWFSVKPKLSSEGRGSNSWKPHSSHVASGKSRQLPRPLFTTRKMGLTTSFALAYLK